MEIKVLAKQGHGIREIAREIGVSRNTVRRYLRDPSIETGRRQSAAARTSKLHEFHSVIEQRVAAAAPHWIPATVIFREMVTLGYTGGMTQLRRFVARLRPLKAPEPLIRFGNRAGATDAM